MYVRRAIAIAAVAGMGLTMAACGGQNTAGTPQAGSSAALSAGSSVTAPSPSEGETTSSDSAPSSSDAAPSSEAAPPSSSDAAPSSSSDAAPSSSSAAAPSNTGSTSSSASASAKTTEKSSAASGKTPAWGYPGTSKGKKIGVVKNDSIQVEVYQVAVKKSAKNSMLVDAKTKKPLIAKGDKIVWVNYVVTNIGKKPIDLSSLLVDIQARYPDWAYLSGMASITDSAQAKELGVHTFGIKPNTGDAPYVFKPGESYAVGENFAYNGPKHLDLKVKVVPQGANGKLDHDHTTQFEGSVKIA